MGSPSLSFTTPPPALDIANNGLPSAIHCHALYLHHLLPLRAIALERIHLSRDSALQLVQRTFCGVLLRSVLDIVQALSQHHRCLMCGSHLRQQQHFGGVARFPCIDKAQNEIGRIFVHASAMSAKACNLFYQSERDRLSAFLAREPRKIPMYVNLQGFVVILISRERRSFALRRFRALIRFCFKGLRQLSFLQDLAIRA